MVVPDANEPVSFDKHVKTWFREQDRESMEFAFDLWDYGDVKENADAILGRLQDGSMPCDGAWPPERVQAFERWVTTGTPQ